MMIAVALFVVHRWATNQPAVTTQLAVAGVFAILVVAFMDQGELEPVAKGFAWLFLVLAAYNAIPSLAKAATPKGTAL
jgi:hypothetical protein